MLSCGVLRPERATKDDLDAVITLLADFPVSWHLCGGWAIDAFLGRETREHSDIEIGIDREHQHHIHAFFPAAEIFKIVDREILPWDGERIDLPWHQVIIRQPNLHEFEFFLNEIDGDLWRSRKRPSLTVPAATLWTRSPWGCNVVAPEIQLLFKSTYHRPKDDHDFEAVRPHLSPARVAWLREILRTYRPGDPWIPQLEATA